MQSFLLKIGCGENSLPRSPSYIGMVVVILPSSRISLFGCGDFAKQPFIGCGTITKQPINQNGCGVVFIICQAVRLSTHQQQKKKIDE